MFVNELYFQENLLSVENVEEQPAYRHISHFEQERSPFFGQGVCQPTEQKFVGVAERKELLRHIDCYGVHAYNLQRERPTAPSSHINQVVEQCKHRKAVSAHHQYE